MGDEEAKGAEVVAPKLNPTTGAPWTDEERRAQSERAKELVRQGRFGGASHGRRKKIPAYAVIAATAQKNGKALADELVNIAKHGSTEKLRMDAIKLLTDIEQKAKQERRDDEEHLQRLPRDQLMQAVIDRMEELTGEDYDIELGSGEVQDVSDETDEAESGGEAEEALLQRQQ